MQARRLRSITIMTPSTFEIFHHPQTWLRLTVPGDKSYLSVKPVWSAPLTRPGKYLALLDGKGDEIAMLPDPEVLSSHSLAAVEKELHHRYLTAKILSIKNAYEEFGATYWEVQTNRGPREFITQDLHKNAQWLGEDHLLLFDVDGCRFEIPSVAALDVHSREIIKDVL
jgi:hypothetical protein